MTIELPRFEETWPEAFATLSPDEKRKVVGIAEVGVLEGWTPTGDGILAIVANLRNTGSITDIPA
jgi:hypothetical protein